MVEHATPDAARYKPSVNIAQAPSILAPLLYIGPAYGFLMVAAILFVFDAKGVAEGAYKDPGVLMMVHFFTLGFLSMTAMGILNQWVPVVFDVLPLGIRRVFIQFILYLGGILGFTWGLAQREWDIVAVGGSVLALAIVIWSAAIFSQMAQSPKSRDAVYRGIQSAVLGLNVVWILGVFMALSFLGWWSVDPVLRVHVATALVAWMGFLVLTVQQKLNPMFSMSKAEGINLRLPFYLAAAGVLISWVSLVTSALWLRMGAVLWVVTAVVVLVQLVRIVQQSQSQTFDRVFVGVGAAWLLLLVAAVFAVWLDPLAVLLAFWGLLTLIFSYQARIVPFMVAVTVAKRLPGPIFKAFFMAQAMQAKNQPLLVGLLGVVGAALAVIGRIKTFPEMEMASGGIALLLVGLEITNLAIAMAQGRKAALIRS